MEFKYLTLPFVDKTVYFHIEMKKFHVYSAHGIDYQDYLIIINENYIFDNNTVFEDTYGGLYLVIDENKEIKIYDNIEKKFIEIEKNNDTREICYFYNDIKYNCVSLDYGVKEMLFYNIIQYYNIH